MIACQRVMVAQCRKKIKFIGNATLTVKQKRFILLPKFCTNDFFQLRAPYAYLRSYLSDENAADADVTSKLTTSESKDPDVTVITGTSNELSEEPGRSGAEDKSNEKPTTENILTDL